VVPSISILTSMAFWHMMVVKVRCLAVGVLLFQTCPAMGEKPNLNIVPDWSFNSAKDWVSRSLRMGPLFQLQVNGRGLLSVPDPKKDGEDEGGGADVTVVSAELDDKPIALHRRMLLDKKRNAILIVDLFTNKEDSQQSLEVSYTTNLSAGRKLKYNGVIDSAGTFVEQGGGVAPNSVGGIILAESDDTTAVPLFLWGQQEAAWAPAVTDIGSARLSIRYGGTLQPRAKVALVHWVATAGLDPNVKVENSLERFWTDGHLVDTLLPPGVEPVMVGNFKPETFIKPTPQDRNNLPGPLLALDEKCGKLGLKRGSSDVLWLGKSEQLTGKFTADSVSLQRLEGASAALPIETVAAVQGGAGRGRLHRVWLRDGSVLSGRVTLEKGSLEGDAGTVVVTGDALEFLLLKGLPEDGTPPASSAGLLQTGDGDHLWLDAAPFASLDLISAFGRVSLPGAEIMKIQRRTEPPFAQQVILADGTSLLGVFGGQAWQGRLSSGGGVSLPTSRVQVWTTKAAWNNEASPKEDTAPARYAILKDGSRLSGAPQESLLQLKTSGGEVTVRLEDVAMLKFENTSSVVVTLRSGAKIQGVLVTDQLTWNIAGQKIAVPAVLVTELDLGGQFTSGN